MTLTITLTNARVVDGFIEAANRNSTTAEALAAEFLTQQGKAYADLYGVGVITSAAFITRFTPQEYAGILAAAEVSPEIKALLDTLLAEPVVNFADPRLAPGVQQLADAQLIAPERVDVLLAYDRPVPASNPPAT